MDGNDGGADLIRARNKALAALGLGVVAGYALGVPTSFVKRRGSLPWEPSHMLVAGTIWALVITVFTVLVLVLLQRYVTLHRTGTRVVGQVVSERQGPNGRGTVVQFHRSSGELRYGWLAPSALSVGQQTTVIVGAPTSNLILLHDGTRYRRASALDAAQIAQLAGSAG
jgi:hypothetical protein